MKIVRRYQGLQTDPLSQRSRASASLAEADTTGKDPVKLSTR